jgi:hypothetical protein
MAVRRDPPWGLEKGTGRTYREDFTSGFWPLKSREVVRLSALVFILRVSCGGAFVRKRGKDLILT